MGEPDYERVRTRAAGQIIDAWTTGDPVVPSAAVDQVNAPTPGEDVGIGAACDCETFSLIAEANCNAGSGGRCRQVLTPIRLGSARLLMTDEVAAVRLIVSLPPARSMLVNALSCVALKATDCFPTTSRSILD